MTSLGFALDAFEGPGAGLSLEVFAGLVDFLGPFVGLEEDGMKNERKFGNTALALIPNKDK